VVSLSDITNSRSVIRKVVITTVVGLVAFPFTQLLFDALTGQILTAAAFSSIVLLVQFLADFEKRLVGVETQLVESIAAVREVVSEGFSKVNDATGLMAQVETAGLQTVVVTRLMRNAAGISPQVPCLVRSLAQKEIERVSTFLRHVRDGEANYEGEDQDWLLGLTCCAQSTIDAISMPEVDAAGNYLHSFWETSLGRHYLDAQRDAIQREVTVRRVFVTQSDEPAKDQVLQRICRIQTELGIEVRLLKPSSVPRATKVPLFDFILFDNILSYEAIPAANVELGETPMIVSTRLILRSASVETRVKRYQSIWAAATPWFDTESRGGNGRLLVT
jgi:hypothetical protein